MMPHKLRQITQCRQKSTHLWHTFNIVKRMETYHELLLVFFFYYSSVVIANGSTRVREVEAVLAFAAVTSSSETQSRNMFTLYVQNQTGKKKGKKTINIIQNLYTEIVMAIVDYDMS